MLSESLERSDNESNSLVFEETRQPESERLAQCCGSNRDKIFLLVEKMTTLDIATGRRDVVAYSLDGIGKVASWCVDDNGSCPFLAV